MEEIELADKYIKNSKKIKDKINNLTSSLVKIDNIEVKLNDEKIEKYENVSGYSVIISSEVDASYRRKL